MTAFNFALHKKPLVIRPRSFVAPLNEYTLNSVFVENKITSLPPAETYNTYQWGIGLNHFYGQFIFFKVPRWKTVSIGDVFSVWINDTRIAMDTVTAETLDNYEFKLKVDKAKLIAPRLTAVYAKVERVGSGNIGLSPKEDVLFIPDRPGGESALDSTRWHSKLNLTIKDYAPGDPMDAKALATPLVAVIDKWDNIRPGDTVHLYLGTTEVVFGPLTVAQAKQTRFEITIEPSITKPLGIIDGDLVIQYFLKNVVDTTSGETRIWSAPIIMPIVTGAAVVDGPDAEPADYSDPSGLYAINIDESPISVSINPRSADRSLYVSPRTLEVTVNGITAEGLPLSQIFFVPLKSPVKFPLKSALPPELLLAALNGIIRLSYRLLNADGTVLRRSRSTSFRVIGSMRKLDAPVVAGGYVKNPNEPQLILFPVSDTAKAIIDPNDSLTLIIQGTNSITGDKVTYTAPVRRAGEEPRSQTVGAEVWRQFVGLSNVQISYTVAHLSDVYTSQICNTVLGPISSSLLMPVLVPVKDGVVLIDDVTDNALLTLQSNFAAGDTVIAVATVEGGGTGMNTPFVLGFDTDTLEVDVPRGFLETNRGKTLLFYFLHFKPGRARVSDTLTVKVPPGISFFGWAGTTINSRPDNSVLRLEEIPAGTNPIALTPPWIGIAAGQVLWVTLTCPGVAALKLREAYVISAAEALSGIKTAVARTWLAGIPDASFISVVTQVADIGTTDVTRAVTGREIHYEVWSLLSLLNDETRLAFQSLNNWRRGPHTASLMTLSFLQDPKIGLNYSLFGDTKTESSSGSVLTKTFNNMYVGRTYAFDVYLRDNNPSNPSRFLLETDLGPVTATQTLTSTYVWLNGTFVANSRTMNFFIQHNEARPKTSRFGSIWIPLPWIPVRPTPVPVVTPVVTPVIDPGPLPIGRDQGFAIHSIYVRIVPL